jgi:hypothetical protein
MIGEGVNGVVTPKHADPAPLHLHRNHLALWKVVYVPEKVLERFCCAA